MTYSRVARTTSKEIGSQQNARLKARHSVFTDDDLHYEARKKGLLSKVKYEISIEHKQQIQ